MSRSHDFEQIVEKNPVGNSFVLYCNRCGTKDVVGYLSSNASEEMIEKGWDRLQKKIRSAIDYWQVMECEELEVQNVLEE